VTYENRRNPLPGLLLIRPDVFGDHRGYFQESWDKPKYAEVCLDRDFGQDNLSFSGKGIRRGLHFQNPQPKGKLVQALQGEMFDVTMDIRKGSPNIGAIVWHGAFGGEPS
jgi:dTDP-4-dehydrorhamnose 3,5-epimerase